jgi:hypothetical protein
MGPSVTISDCGEVNDTIIICFELIPFLLEENRDRKNGFIMGSQLDSLLLSIIST